MKQWYVLYTKPNAEYQVVAALQQREIQTFLPEIEYSHHHRHQQRKPFFPCYLFVKLDLEVTGISSVQWTPGLRHIVAYNNQPVPVPEEIINLIRHELGEGKSKEDSPFASGDAVRITNGPFRDMLAIFDKTISPNKRVQVLLNILGQTSRLQIRLTVLEKVSIKTKTPVTQKSRRTRGQGRLIKQPC